MATLTNAKSIYDYIMSRPVPAAWTTPDGIKNAYKGAVGAASAYQPLITEQLKKYGSYQPVTSTKEYKNLLALYNRRYQADAALAAAETVKASEGMNAGYGDTYSRAAIDQAYTNGMAQRGSAIPALMAAASDAYANGKSAIAAGINALGNQRDMRMQAMQNLYNSKWGAVQKATTAKQNAYNTLISSLGDAYNYQYAKEKEEAAARAAAARASSRSGSSGSGSGYTYGGKSSGKTKEKDDFLQQLIYLYDEFLKNYPRLKKHAMSPQVYLTHKGLSAQKGNMYLYDAYLQDVIKNHTITGSKGGHYSK